MNRSISLIFLFFLLFQLVGNPLCAQVSDSLSTDSELFFQQVSEILTTNTSKTYEKKSKELLDRFYQRWTIGRFNKDEKDEIRNLIETMRVKKMRTYPHLYDYVYTLTLLSESTQPPKSILAWHAYADSLLLEKNASPFSDLLTFTDNLLEKDQLHEKRSNDWFVRQTRFRFDLDTTFLVHFDKVRLVCASRKDSAVIEKTSGVFQYTNQTWYGDGGVVNWSRFGEAMGEDIFVELPKYQLNLDEPVINADSAILHYGRFFEQPVVGAFRDKVLASSPSERSQYPMFTAYLTDIDLPEIYKNIHFYGGIQIEGPNLYGIAAGGKQATITISRNDTVFGKLTSDKFRIVKDNAISAHATTVFYFENDSLYHPGLRVKYTDDDQQFVLYNEEDGSNAIPFYDSYHQLDIYVQALFWKLSEDDMLFKRIRTMNDKNLAYFVSSNYYSNRDFYQLQGIDDLHPLYVIQNYMKAYDVEEIQLYALADYMQKSVDQVSAMLIRLSNKGFLVYNTETETAIAKERLSYFLNAKSGFTDYDVIRLESNVTTRPNAALNIPSLGLNVYGVPEVSISDSQEVYIYPYDRNIQFFKNRDFNFDGHVHMGLLDFYTRNSTFIYDSFLLRMNYVDSLAFIVKSQDSLSRIDSLIHVHNVITNLNGSIYIDDPNNKSSLKKFPQFPTFVSNDDSYVYYNRKSIQDSTLIADRFYYRVDPFVFDSIKTFSTEGLAFEGTLISAGIFPDVSEPLVVTPDYSLGFKHTTPADGYPVYDKKGVFTHDIFLSNEGFFGQGKLDYLTSESHSDKFIFYPDSLIATGQTFVVRESPVEFDFPSVQGDTVDIQWLIDTNVMFVDNLSKPFIVYNSSMLKGTLALNPAYMIGSGAFFFDQSELVSNAINFNYNRLAADTSDFYLKNRENDSLVFYANQYQSQINFDDQMGWFTHIYNNSFLKFPFNKYISTLDEVEWQMNEDVLLLQSNLGKDYQGMDTLNNMEMIDCQIVGPEFISVKPDQDSLRFYAGQASYDLKNYTIDIESVKMIKVADVAVFPDKEKVRVLRDAGMETLKNASIIADTKNKYHRIYQAEVNVYGKHQFTGKGWIDYVDRLGAKQPVYLSDIASTTSGITTGFGRTQPEEVFFLSPEYLYEGALKMIASEPHLVFEGGYRLNQECVLNYNNWVSFNQILDPQDIVFNLADSTYDLVGEKVYYGLAYDDDFRKYYPLVFQPLRNPGDRLLMDAKGQLVFDTLSNNFVVGHRNKLAQNQQINPDQIVLETEKCILSGRGNLNLGLDLHMLNSTFTGSFEHLIVPDSTRMQVVMALDFFFDVKLLDMITDSLRLSYNPGVTDPKGIFPLFLKKNLPLGTDAEELSNELALYGQIRKLPDLLKQTMIFTDLNLYWDSYTRSYYSKGKIGLGYLGGNTINKYLDGYIQIEPGVAGSTLNMYLSPAPGKYYFFSYKNGIMQVLSSDMAFNEKLETLKPEKRVLNENSDVDYYEFVISTKRKMIDFVREMESR